MKPALTGGCLCGGVRYSSSSPAIKTVHCFCSDCRRIGGTGHATHTVLLADGFDISGDMTEYEKTADSGNRINRRFCKACGSAIFHTRDGMEGKIVLRTSSLDDPEAVKPEMNIYTISAVSWDQADTTLPCFEKMSVPGNNTR